jgi:hypothetical protein|tara:strand:- start:882 stop:1103 length:222 start_codon:yes stop_codon:yes gene_type:complete
MSLEEKYLKGGGSMLGPGTTIPRTNPAAGASKQPRGPYDTAFAAANKLFSLFGRKKDSKISNLDIDIDPKRYK